MIHLTEGRIQRRAYLILTIKEGLLEKVVRQDLRRRGIYVSGTMNIDTRHEIIFSIIVSIPLQFQLKWEYM